jgi:hypothetical protein
MSKAIHRKAIKECVIVTDGYLHTLERDGEAQRNFFDNKAHCDYNRWKSKYSKKGLYFFSLDNSII